MCQMLVKSFDTHLYTPHLFNVSIVEWRAAPVFWTRKLMCFEILQIYDISGPFDPAQC